MATNAPNKSYDLLATGEATNTWGIVNNANYSIIDLNFGGRLSKSVAGAIDVTLSATECRNVNHTLTGVLTGNINVIYPNVGSFYSVKNGTTGSFTLTIKPDGGSGIIVPQGSTVFVFTNPDAAAMVQMGDTIVNPIISGNLTPATNDGASLGTTSLSWSDLYLASGGTINWANGDVVLTQSSGVLNLTTGDLRVTATGTNAASVALVGGTQTLTSKTLTSPVLNTPTVGTSILPSSNDGAALGAGATAWSDLFLASGGLINWANGDAVITHSSGILTVSTGDWRITTAGTNSASAVTVGGTQTLTNKTLTSPTITGATVSSPTITSPTITGGGSLAGTFSGTPTFSGATVTFSNAIFPTTIELGAASDTTLARGSAGVVTVEGTALLRASQNLSDVSSASTARGNLSAAVKGLFETVNAQTGTTYTIALSDIGGLVTMSNGSANTLTIPTNASVAFATGTIISVAQIGAGTTTIASVSSSVTLNGTTNGSTAITARYNAATIIKIDTNTWLVEGSHGAVS